MQDFNFTVLPGTQLNPKQKVVEAIVKRINLNEGYCPCDQGDTPKEDTKCPCKKYKEEQYCCCGLYQKLSFPI